MENMEQGSHARSMSHTGYLAHGNSKDEIRGIIVKE